MRSGAPISAAMIIASVVLPRPGGPDSSTWSGGRPRRWAASSTSASCSRTRSWPTNSSSVRAAAPPRRRARRRRRRVRPARRARGPGAAARPLAAGQRSVGRGHASCRLSCAGRPAAARRRRPARRRRRRRPSGRRPVDRLVGLAGPTSRGRPGRRAPGRATARPLPAAAARRRGADAPGGPSRSLSSSTMRWAPFGRCRAPRSARRGRRSATARRSASGVCTASIARASRGRRR